MAETVTNRRRIDRLKALAIEQGFTNEDAKQFGKLSKTATWEALLETYGVPLHPVDTSKQQCRQQSSIA
jgi:crotonobetainyl-CoA:carnitine CoA-transferase CaiB-like acyl-CoA transferase